MSLILDGTNGLSDVDGTAATPAIRGTDTNTGIFFPAADTIAFAEGGAEVMRLNSSGYLGIGTTAPSTPLRVQGVANITTYGNVSGAFSDGVTGTLYVQHSSGLVQLGSDTGLSFGTGSSATERMRILSSGAIRIGTNASSAAWMLIENPNNVSGVFNTVTSLGSNANNTSSYHLLCATGGADKLYILGNGNVQNVNNSYGALSDVKLKENIVDATPKLEKLNQVRVVSYNLKENPEQKLLGVVAQELEQIFPSMIEETPDRDAEGNVLDTTTKAVKYSVFVPMLIKAIQEQQAIITELKATVDAQEARIAALENPPVESVTNE